MENEALNQQRASMRLRLLRGLFATDQATAAIKGKLAEIDAWETYLATMRDYASGLGSHLAQAGDIAQICRESMPNLDDMADWAKNAEQAVDAVLPKVKALLELILQSEQAAHQCRATWTTFQQDVAVCAREVARLVDLLAKKEAHKG